MNVAVRADVVTSGVPLSTATGGVSNPVSHVCTIGDGSTVPAAPTARTTNSCSP